MEPQPQDAKHRSTEKAAKARDWRQRVRDEKFQGFRYLAPSTFHSILQPNASDTGGGDDVRERRGADRSGEEHGGAERSMDVCVCFWW